MKRSLIACLVVMVAAAASAAAHHSPVMFDRAVTRTLVGTVVEFAWMNPHSSIQLAVPNDKGGTDRWGVELGSPRWQLELLGTVWFRSVFPRLSVAWRERLLTVLADSIVLPNHVLRLGRREIRMRDASLPELKELFSKSSVSEAVRADVRLLMAIGNLWGSESFSRLQFTDDSSACGPASKLTLMMFRR